MINYIYQMRIHWLSFIVLVCVSGCQTNSADPTVSFEVYCEMVANNAKPIALSTPMARKEVNESWDRFQYLAKEYNVKIHRETDFPVTLLFPKDATSGKEVVVIYQGARLNQYQQLKSSIQQADPGDENESLELARRMGRLLGYSPKGINGLLIKNSEYRNLEFFGLKSQVTHLYYQDVTEAISFYSNTLGLRLRDDSTFFISENALIRLHANNAEHPAGQPKSTAIALLTDQLPEWYGHIQKHQVPIKYTYKPRQGGPHDGFVAIDPGGYLLEFEQFKQHPENELFMAELDPSNTYLTTINSLSFYGSITWTYHRDLLQMQNHYQQVWGFQLVADQGWTKIFQTSSSGFIGLVDERRGMMDYADEKAVEIEWMLEDPSGFHEFASGNWESYEPDTKTCKGPEQYIYRFGE